MGEGQLCPRSVRFFARALDTRKELLSFRGEPEMTEMCITDGSSDLGRGSSSFESELTLKAVLKFLQRGYCAEHH